MRFTAANAMGRNKIAYGLADVTLVVCSDNDTGGTWEEPRKQFAEASARSQSGPATAKD